MDALDMGQREENRRALLRQYSTYMLQYAAFGVILAVAFIGELVLLLIPSFPSFVIYPLALVTAIPAVLCFYFMVYWWRMQGYALSAIPEGMEGDSLPELHQTYRKYAQAHSSRFVAESIRVLDGKRIAVVILAAFLIALPVSYYAVTFTLDSTVAVGILAAFLVGVIFAFVLPKLTTRRETTLSSQAPAAQAPMAGTRSDEILQDLALEADKLRLAANEQALYQTHDRSQTQAQFGSGESDRIVGAITELSKTGQPMLPHQTDAVTRAVSSMTSSLMMLGLTADAGRIYSAYRKLIPK